jgi:predicted O-linked N-acetylglucosamine transferase (SPINDLY family)
MRLKSCFNKWLTITGLSDQALAECIQRDGIDILIDLSGHTANNRLPAFAYKPAPIQASWLGYFATTGVKEVDYWIGDPFVTPTEDAEHSPTAICALPRPRKHRLSLPCRRSPTATSPTVALTACPRSTNK